jgi:hypothetical protein
VTINLTSFSGMGEFGTTPAAGCASGCIEMTKFRATVEQ